MGHRILAVDDDPEILRLLEQNLGKAGFSVVCAHDGLGAFTIARKELPDLVILDIALPEMEGAGVLKALKKDHATEKIPVMMLTSKGEEMDMIAGLELGADTYIIKPFSIKELLLRVNVLLKKKEGCDKDDGVITAGPLAIDPGRFQVIADGAALKLTSAEFKLLVELVKSNGRLLGREYLVKKISAAGAHSTFRTVDTHIRRLRVKLGPCSGCIETVRGIGYKFQESF